MNGFGKRFTLVTMLGILLMFGFVLAACDSESDAQDEEPLDRSAPLTRLSAEGTKIVNAEGHALRLRGVNLGGWIFHEPWITLSAYSLRARIHELGTRETFSAQVDDVLEELGRSDKAPDYLDRFGAALNAKLGSPEVGRFLSDIRTFDVSLDDDSDLPLRRKLATRFGEDERDELMDAFQSAWITEKDIAFIAEQGFNVVRVPMGYRDLTRGADLDKPSVLLWNERTFSRLDALLGWCAEHRVYAVLDIQEAPGGQNDYSGTAQLYDDPAMQTMTVKLWEELSRRYSSRDEIAAYSLLAEPYGAPNAEARDAMYDLLVKAIRAKNDNHLLIIHDGFKGMTTLPAPQEMGWDNVVYSTHIFEFDATSKGYYEERINLYYDTLFKAGQKDQNVPYYIGSFSTQVDESWAYEAAELLLSWYAERGWSWSIWTYKKLDEPLDNRLWDYRTCYGVRGGQVPSGFQRPDPEKDDLETLKAKFSAYADMELTPNQSLLDIMKKY